jgi:hypothetical protein
VAGGGLVVGGAAVTVHGTAVAANSLHLLAKDAAEALQSGQAANSGGNSPEPSAKKTQEGRQASSGETPATAKGRKAHRDWDPGPGFEKEVTLPSGKRADAVNPETKQVKELKPDNARAMKRGEKQVEQYRKELENEYGGKWRGNVETYK